MEKQDEFLVVGIKGVRSARHPRASGRRHGQKQVTIDEERPHARGEGGGTVSHTARQYEDKLWGQVVWGQSGKRNHESEQNGKRKREEEPTLFLKHIGQCV